MNQPHSSPAHFVLKTPRRASEAELRSLPKRFVYSYLWGLIQGIPASLLGTALSCFARPIACLPRKWRWLCGSELLESDKSVLVLTYFNVVARLESQPCQCIAGRVVAIQWPGGELGMVALSKSDPKRKGLSPILSSRDKHRQALSVELEQNGTEGRGGL